MQYRKLKEDLTEFELDAVRLMVNAIINQYNQHMAVCTTGILSRVGAKNTHILNKIVKAANDYDVACIDDNNFNVEVTIAFEQNGTQYLARLNDYPLKVMEFVAGKDADTRLRAMQLFNNNTWNGIDVAYHCMDMVNFYNTRYSAHEYVKGIMRNIRNYKKELQNAG